jgi:2-iminobutanoate/2-iminopropanoate deaminase
MVSIESLGYVEASTAIAAGMQAAQRFGRPMAFAVMDQAGDLIASARMDDVPARVLRQATRKAYTAAKMGRNTLTLKKDLEERANTLGDWGDQDFTTLQGGLVVRATMANSAANGILGALACGGGTLETDEEVARIMVRSLGLEPVLDERLLVPWRARAFSGLADKRTRFLLPVDPLRPIEGLAPLTAVRLRGVVHTSGICGIDPRTGELPDDPERQFALAFQNLRNLLEMAGVKRAEEIGLMTYFIPDASYRKFINKPWMEYFPGAVRPARKTNQVALPTGMCVQLQAVAHPGETLVPLEIPGLFHRDPLPMGARIGPQVFSSVIGGQDPLSGRTSADPVAQIRCAFDNMGRFMRAAGASLDQVSHVWVFMQPHFPYHDQMVVAWVDTFPDAASRPARKTLPYPGLTGDNHIQLQVTGILEGGSRTNYEIEHVHHIDPIPMGARIGRFLYSSGIGGLDPEKGKRWVRPVIHSTEDFMVAGLLEQTRQSLEHVRTLMHNAGGSLDDVVALTVLVQRLGDAAVVADQIRRCFADPDNLPALHFIAYKLPAHLEMQLHVTAVLA